MPDKVVAAEANNPGRDRMTSHVPADAVVTARDRGETMIVLAAEDVVQAIQLREPSTPTVTAQSIALNLKRRLKSCGRSIAIKMEN